VALVSPPVDPERRSWPSQLVRWQVEMSTQSWRLRGLALRDYSRAGLPRAARTFAWAMRYRPEEEIARLELPALLVHAGRDPLLRVDWVRRLAHRAPDARLATVPGAVHAMSHDNPLELARLVDGFADRLAERADQGADVQERRAA
jgi:2-hydroxy-6-oxonona-2,4-dienedioate hydrolase